MRHTVERFNAIQRNEPSREVFTGGDCLGFDFDEGVVYSSKEKSRAGEGLSRHR